MTLLDKKMCWFFWGVSFIYVVLLGEFFIRGLDITDESFYLINYEHWSELAGVVSFFGAYLSLPYYLLGESIWAIRFFGLFMLMAAAYFFSLGFFKKLFANELDENYIKIGATTVACAAVTFYSVFGTLYTPGYNLLNLVLILFSTGLLLQLAQKTEPNIANYFLYGLSMGAIFFTKFPSFFTTLAAHILLVILICSHERWWFIAKILVAVLAGMLVNYGYLALQARDILKMFSVGLENGALLSPRDILKEIHNLLILDIPNIVQGTMPSLLPIILRVIVIVTLALFLTRQIKEWCSWSVFLVIAIAFGPLGFLSSRYLLNSSVWTAILLLWSICLFVSWRNKNYSVTAFIKTSLLSAIVSLLPIAHSFGTGNEVQLAVGMGTVFPIAVCIGLLIFLRSGNFIGRLSFFVSLAIISLAPLLLIAMQWNQPDRTYRLLTGLDSQNINVRIGKAVVAVDDKTASAFRELKTILHENGYTEGTPMLDMTDSPGLVLVANGRPLGSAWLFVGYPGSEAVASSVLARHVRLEEVRAAWILSTPSPNAGLDWVGIMRKVLGSVPFKKVGSFCLPVAEGKNSCDSSGGLSKTIEIWAPIL